jgi:hypothetical protein
MHLAYALRIGDKPTAAGPRNNAERAWEVGLGAGFQSMLEVHNLLQPFAATMPPVDASTAFDPMPITIPESY